MTVHWSWSWASRCSRSCWCCWRSLVGAITGWYATSIPTDAATLGLAAASGVVYYALAYVCYVAALRQVPAAVAASVLPLIPVWGLAAAFLAGDRLTTLQWLGAAVVGAAVLAVALRSTVEERAEAAALQQQ